MNPVIRSLFCLRSTVVLLATLFVTVVSAHAQTLTVLHSFMSAPDGLTPIGGVIMNRNIFYIIGVIVVIVIVLKLLGLF